MEAVLWIDDVNHGDVLEYKNTLRPEIIGPPQNYIFM